MADRSLTVAVVNLNSGRDLPLTIESIIGQSYSNIQLIVVDGHSFDNSYDIMKRYISSIEKFHRVEDSGIYDAMNQAAHVADGDYILFLNAGDRFYSQDSVEACMDRIGDDPDIFYGDHVYVDGRIEKHVRSAHFDLLQMQLHRGHIDHAWHVHIPGHQATFTRTKLLRDMPHDTRYAICGDHDFLFRVHAAGGRMQYIDDIVCHYMAGGLSDSQGTIIHREWAHAYRKHSLRPLDVDKFFFQTDAWSPFPAFTDYSGKILKGIRKEFTDTAQGEHHMLIDSLSLRSPVSTETIGLHFKGSVGDIGKKITFRSDGHMLGAEILQSQSFDFHSAFVKPLQPNQALDIHLDDDNSPSVGGGLILNRLYFIDSYKIYGNSIDVGSFNLSILEQIFVDGWMITDDNPEHIWSHTDQPSISFSIDRDISDLRFSFTRDDGDEYMDISVIINGVRAGKMGIYPKITHGEFKVNVEDSWKTGANIIRLCIEKRSKGRFPRHETALGINKITWEYLS